MAHKATMLLHIVSLKVRLCSAFAAGHTESAKKYMPEESSWCFAWRRRLGFGTMLAGRGDSFDIVLFVLTLCPC